NELGVDLFSRVMRNIKLTPEGRVLRERALDILAREESTRIEIGKNFRESEVVIVGADFLIRSCFEQLEGEIRKSLPDTKISVLDRSRAETLEGLESGEAYLGVVIGLPPPHFSFRKLHTSIFKTCVSTTHFLAQNQRREVPIKVEELLKFPFVTIKNNLFGPVAENQSADGWRDDKFPRKIYYAADSTKILEFIVTSGRGVAYLPDYIANSLNLKILSITGCPFVCKHDVYLVSKNADSRGFLKNLFQ
ncbi:MAG: LysR family transcriptional regulator, partial [Proteobacteria bacterium]|nr:LysR family transcriptional regulator [Pseudomonadota bacterium]